MAAQDWYLTPSERGNPSTFIDVRESGLQSWTNGNRVQVLAHGARYFDVLARRIAAMGEGDLLLFADWRGDPDERLQATAGSEINTVLCEAARRGVDVRGLIWRSHLDKFAFSAAENRHLGEEINKAGGECFLDMRVRPGGSHHQKFVVLRHPGRPTEDVAFVGGIDLCHSRRDDEAHLGDEQPVKMAQLYGPRPPWHDVQLMIEGPAVGDFETVFRERWDDPRPMSRSPVRLLTDHLRDDQPRRPSALPARWAAPPEAGPHPVQVLRTYPNRRPGYSFAQRGERSVARAYQKAIARARRLIYLEDQYLWSRPVARTFAEALRRNPGLHLIAVLPHYPDQDGAVSSTPFLLARQKAMRLLREAGGDRVAFYGVENSEGTPVYVHAKVCVIDDEWASVGSDNFNLRSWTHDSELSAAVCHPEFATDLRICLALEHLELSETNGLGLLDAFSTFAVSAAALHAWHEGGKSQPRPPGRLRPVHQQPMTTVTKIWATALYRTIVDPDGRPIPMRMRRGF